MVFGWESRDLICDFEYSGEIRMKFNQNWCASPSKVASHFGTSGVAIAKATGITQPLGFFQ